MTSYLYPAPSLVDRVHMIRTEKGGYRAYIKLQEGAPSQQYGQVRQAIEAQHWQAIPAYYLGKPALEVRGFSRPDEVLDILQQRRWVVGKPRELPSPGDTLSLKDKILARSLQLSGLMYAISDIGYIMYGVKEQHKLDMAAGFAYMAGTWALLAFGRNDKADKQVRDLSRRLVSHLQAQQQDIPADCALTHIAEEQKRGTFEKLEDYLSRYPAELFGTFTGTAGLLIMASALRHKVPFAQSARAKSSAWADVGLGSLTAASSFGGIMIKEKHHDPDGPPPANWLEQGWRWIEEKPLRLTGYGLMVSTLFHAYSTSIDYADARKFGNQQKLSSIPFRAAFIVGNLIAEFMMAISSKGHGEGVEADKSVRHSMISIASELIAKEKPAMHEMLVTQMAQFLGRPEVLGEKNSEIAAQLREEVARARNNPWAGCGRQAGRTGQTEKPRCSVGVPCSLPQRMASQAPEVPIY